jgi:hypothetical protein
MRLPGPRFKKAAAPVVCEHCQSKHFFIQPDFNRSLGLWLIAIASLATFVLAIWQYSWWVIWSPLPLALILDRGWAAFTPNALVCYSCDAVYEIQDPSAFKNFKDFDLELHDRLQMQNSEST